MKERPHRRNPPAPETRLYSPLEGRTLLAAAPPTATWIGQDGQDLVGRSSVPGPERSSGHRRRSGGPADERVDREGRHHRLRGRRVGVLPVRRAGTVGGCARGCRRRARRRRTFSWSRTRSRPDAISGSRSPTATNRPRLLRGFMAARPTRTCECPGTRRTATWLGQDVQDLTGPEPGVGPDGYPGRAHRPVEARPRAAPSSRPPRRPLRGVLGVRRTTRTCSPTPS